MANEDRTNGVQVDPPKRGNFPMDPMVFKDHDNYYAWRNVVPAVGDVTVSERERDLVTAYISRLELTVITLSEKVPTNVAPWPWETIHRD